MPAAADDDDLSSQLFSQSINIVFICKDKATIDGSKIIAAVETSAKPVL